MPKKQEKKTAKGRLDKFYHLAKQQGFRSRAAFKLVQLNKKYGVLDKARCCIDLCAAPGGWLQVASRQMPPGSLIVGVDLVPIKPIPRCITFAEDINSFKCRDQLRAELKDWKADVVLHDGAPNVGTAWIQDAYAQSELVLQSLKLAVEFLAPGGHFVTKVFRSKDYNNLLWVFNQLFHKVEATKPPSSRNVSAEIFVVCQDFKAPKRIDPKFLDPRHVFKDLDPLSTGTSKTEEVDGKKKQTITMATNAVANVFEPEKKRRKREGYEDGEMILFKALGAKEFIEGADAVGMLGTFNEIQFKEADDRVILQNELTTDDIKACCSDLKVLGKKDFRNLLKWRKTLREELGLELSAKAIKAKEAEEKEARENVEVTEMDEDEAIDEELERLRTERDRRARKERRRKNEERQKRILKMQLSMTTPMDIGMDLVDHELAGEEFFDLQHGGAKKRIMEGEEAEEGEDGEEAEASGSEDEDALDAEERRLAKLEAETAGAYEQYRQRLSDRDAKFRAKEARKKDEHKDEWYGFTKRDEDPDAASDAESSEGGYEEYVRRKAQEETFDTDDEEDEQDEEEMRQAIEIEKRRRNILKRSREQMEDKDEEEEEADSEEEAALVQDLESKKDKTARQSREAAIWFDNPLFKGVQLEEGDDDDEDDDDEEESDDDDDSNEEEDSEEEVSDSDAERSTQSSTISAGEEEELEDDDMNQWQFEDEDQDEIKRKLVEQKGLNTAEAITLASQLVNREKTKTDLIDDGFNKHNFVDKNDLPEWFLDDEGKHFKVNLPITKEAADALKAKQKALDARPIKKIAEAKARKKYKAMQRLEKARKKAEGVSENVDITEREKANNIDKLLRRAGMKPKRKEINVVVAKGKRKGVKGRPKGVKGRYRMVDPRQKKELRAAKRKDKAMGKKSASSSSGSSKNKRRIPNGY